MSRPQVEPPRNQSGIECCYQLIDFFFFCHNSSFSLESRPCPRLVFFMNEIPNWICVTSAWGSGETESQFFTYSRKPTQNIVVPPPRNEYVHHIATVAAASLSLSPCGVNRWKRKSAGGPHISYNPPPTQTHTHFKLSSGGASRKKSSSSSSPIGKWCLNWDCLFCFTLARTL